MDEQTTYTIRLPKTLKDAFDTAAKAADQSGAQVVREHMRRYVEWYMKNHAQADLTAPRKSKK